MKKLMIAVAAAAVGVSAQAKSAKNLDAQVYDFNATVKSTTCKEVKITQTWAALYGQNYKNVKGQKIATRKQASTKIAGVIWGCDCETIADPAWRIYPGTKFLTVGGYLFWNASANVPFNVFTTTFAWALFDRIDDGNKVEGVWALVNDDAYNALALLGAGFGKATGSNCRSILSNMSGNFAGFLLSGSNADGCMFCGSAGCTGWFFCNGCSAYPYNPLTALTAANGTWKIKYNKSASNKLRKTGLLSQSYSFKKAKKSKDADTDDVDAVTILKNIEAAAKRGDLGTPSSDDDDDDYDYDWDEEDFEEFGTKVDNATVGTYAYESKAGEGDGVEPPRLSDEADEEDLGLVVKALLSIAGADAS